MMRASCLMMTAVLVVGLSIAHEAFGAKKGAEPLLFGPTGITGEVSKNSIKVFSVQSGAPADGKLTKGDEIIGIGAAKFKDVKRDMAAAIDVAETETAGGRMALQLKDNRTVEITLPVLGTYSATAPWNCPKTDKIITMTADALLKNLQSRKKKNEGSRLNPELLGLMATGEKKYIDAVGEMIKAQDWSKPDQSVVDKCLSGEDERLYMTWYWGYNLITLGEYYLLTGDKSVLPAIEIYALALAKGQDAGGLYGHRFASPTRFNRLPGYAQMNQPSLTCLMGMIMALRCGIQDPILKKAIQTTYAYVDSHVGQGGFPYGVHGPNSNFFNNNGTSGSAAICMALLNRLDGARYFSQVSATTYDGLEDGHGSSGFNALWTPLGANLSGPEVSQKFFKRSLWYHNLRRNFDGSWSPDWNFGEHEGLALLAYCLPRKALLITGRNANETLWVKGQAADDVILLSKIDYKSKTPEELIALAMEHPLPQIRRAASGALGQHREQLESTWVTFMQSGTPKQKELAVNQYGWWIPIELRLPKLDVIGAVLRDTTQPIGVRVAAAGSIAHMGEPARKYYADIVNLMIEDKPDDPFQLTDMGIGSILNALCPTPFASGLVPDQATHIKAALKLVRHKRQHARTDGLVMLQGIPLEAFHLVADDVLHVIADDDPAYHSYHNPSGPVAEAISILASLNIREGLDYALQIGLNPSGKGSFRMKATWEALGKYRGNAKEALKEWQERRGGQTNFGKHQRGYDAMIKAIEEDKNPPPLISLEEAIKAGKR
jgi:hypothetical protein